MAVLPLAFLAACGAAAPGAIDHPAVGQAVQPCRGWRVERDRIGEHVELPAPGKVTVLDFWSSSCAPCIAAMPELERLWNAVDRERVLIVGVSIDEDDALARRTIEEGFPAKVSFPMVYDGKARKLQGIYKVGGAVPAAFVVDPRGVVRAYFDGSAGAGELDRFVEALLEE